VSRPKVEPQTSGLESRYTSHLAVMFDVRPKDRILFTHCEDHLNAQCVTFALSRSFPSQRLPSAVDVHHSVPHCPIFTTCTPYTHIVPYFCFVVSCSHRHHNKRRLLAHVSLQCIYSLVSCAKHGLFLYTLETAGG
jgi:hypothetical protein